MHHRPPRLLARALVACAPVVGLLLAFGPSAGASTVGGSPSAAAVAAARRALEHLAIGPPTDHRLPGHIRHLRGLTQVQSSNWSGYADTGSGFSAVTGHWTEPAATCGTRNTLAAFWVGIDGYSSTSVEQDGTLMQCFQGTATYYSWWEMYPSNAIQVVGGSVRPGDSITASVVRSGTRYTLKLTDATHTGNSFSTTQSCSCANSSAEWIAEAPSNGASIVPPTDFHTWTLGSATAKTTSKSGVINTFPDNEITMVDTSGRTEVQPGPLNGTGNGFTCTWKRNN